MTTPGTDRVNSTKHHLAQGVSAPAPASDGECGRHPGHSEVVVCLFEAEEHVREFTKERSGGLCRFGGVEEEGVGCEVDGDGVLGGVVGGR